MRMRPWPNIWTSLLVFSWLASACSPNLNWREINPEGSALRVQFPCKPSIQARKVSLAGQPALLNLYACEADGAVWALAWADGVEPARVGEAMRQLREAAAANVGSVPGRVQGWAVPGATPNPQTGRSRVQGRRPDGSALDQDVLVFAYGLRVYQATVLGARLDGAVAEPFFESLRVTGP
jgi:hypothetical protein